MKKDALHLSAILVASLSAYGQSERFTIATWCDPYIAWPDDVRDGVYTPGIKTQATYDPSVLDKLSREGFNTLSGCVCVGDFIQADMSVQAGGVTKIGYPVWKSIEYNDALTRLIGAWNDSRQPNQKRRMRRYIGSIDVRNNVNGLTPPAPLEPKQSSLTFIAQVAAQFGSQYSGPKDVIAGYYIGDEPKYSEEIDRAVMAIKHLKASDPSRPVLLLQNPIHVNWENRNELLESFWKRIAIERPGEIAMNHYLLGWYPYSGYSAKAHLSEVTGNRFIPTLNGVSNGWPIHEADLRVQVSTALAYGAKGITWYGYEQRGGGFPGWYGPEGQWEGHYNVGSIVPNSKANDAVTKVNNELIELSDELVKLQRIATLHGSRDDVLSQDVGLRMFPSRLLTRGDPSALMVGLFRSTNNALYAIICNKSRVKQNNYSFKIPKLQSVSELSRIKNENGKPIAIPLASADGFSTFDVELVPGDYKVIRLIGVSPAVFLTKADIVL